MKKLWRQAVLLFVVLIMVQGCNDDGEPEDGVMRDEREFPASRTRVLGPDETAGEIAIEREEWQDVIIVSGPGSFVSAVVSKKGGNSADLSDHTLVRLWLDRKEVVLKSFEVARVMGLSEQNYSGVAWFDGSAAENVETLVLGYSQPLHFEEVLQLSVKVDDMGVNKVFLSVTYTKVDAGEDENTGGGDGQPDYP